MSAVAQEQSSTVTIDGFLVDVDSGEVVGIAGRERFSITDQASAEWVLEKMGALDADILAIDARLKALAENMAAMKREKEQRRKYLEFRFGPELEQFAKENLPQGKKTWTCPYGSVGFRTTGGGVRVKDPEYAVTVGRIAYPHAIKKTEVFQISQLTPVDMVDLKRGLAGAWAENDETRKAFEIAPVVESVKIQTGIKAEG